jgi:hypothetical protein
MKGDNRFLRSCEKNARKRARQSKPPAALSSIAATKTAEEIEQLGASESAGCQPARRFSTCPTRRGRRGKSSQAEKKSRRILTRAVL